MLAESGGDRLLTAHCWLAPVNGRRRGGAFDVRWTVWEDDPWVRGGYAFLDPGFDPAWRALLSRRAGRMVFATSERWQGYMNGAVESGLRAARELLRRPQ